MKRFLCVAALFALVMIPDWASACWFRRGEPVYYRQAYFAPRYYRTPVAYSTRPRYGQPVVYSQPVYGQPVYMQPYAPQQPMLPPHVQPAKLKSDNLQASPPVSTPIARPESAPPSSDPIVPATRVEPLPTKPDTVHPTVDPIKPPLPATQNDPKHGGGLLQIPKNLTPEPKAPATPKVESKVEEPKLPSLDAPTLPDTGSKLPPIQLPKAGKASEPPKEKEKDPELKLPSVDPPGAAVPVPAPSPDVLIPPTNIPSSKNSALPSLTLPPDTPVVPDKADKPVTLPKEATESKSSPLTTATRELKVTVFPASGNATNAAGLCKVGFFNHTNRDLALTIEGKTVTLPAMSYLHAQLPPTFTWKCANKPDAKETVPADAVGLDVLIRE